MGSRKRSISNDEDMLALHKEWDEASCPICMDHPHNAVLLLCSSHDKGCRSYICDTSYRHSNCLDRFRRLRDENRDSQTIPNSNPGDQHGIDNTSDVNLGFGPPHVHNGVRGGHDIIVVDSTTTQELGNGGGGRTYATDINLGMVGETVLDAESSREVLGSEENNMGALFKSNLHCPLCRGSVLGWKVVEEARRYLNLKRRSCSRESCSFCGNYRELRRHARTVHPAARPADVDPSRQRAWRRLETQREYQDIVSAIRSAMPGALVLGDYVIENGDRMAEERGRIPVDNGSRWFNTFLLFQMIDSIDSGAEQRGGQSRALSRHRRPTAGSSRRRYLWGENLLGLQDYRSDEDDDLELNPLSDIGESAPSNARRQRRRRRFIYSRSNEDHQ